jgi:hypothetical protein
MTPNDRETTMRTLTFWRTSRLALGAGLMLLIAVPCLAQHTPTERKVALHASLDYYYGDWNQGQFDLDPRIGMIGPQVDLLFLGGEFGIGARYLSGDFDGFETISVPDPSVPVLGETYNSRKEMSLDQSREDVYVYAAFHPLSWLGLEAGYKYLDYKLATSLNLVSDLRPYGDGTESYRSEARGAALGARVRVPLHARWTLSVAGLAMPWLDTQMSGAYDYKLELEERSVSEDWSRNGKAIGLYGEGMLEFMVPGEPVALHLGYVYQYVETDDDVDVTWVDKSLGQSARDWQKDRFHAVLLGARFLF